MIHGLLSKALHQLFSVWFGFRNWANFAWLTWLLPSPRVASQTREQDVETGVQIYQREDTPKDETATDVRKEIFVTRHAKGEFISGGLTGIIELLDDGTVLKSPFPGPDLEDHIFDIAKEADIYRRVGPHERIVKLLGHCNEGLLLEYMPKGDLKAYLQSHDSIPTTQRLKWAYQVAEAVNLLHTNGILHCDIKPRNLLLDENLDLKIIDFSGSSLDGSKPTSGEGTRFYLPRHWREPPTVYTDLFALGSTLYEIFQGSSPYAEVPSDQVGDLFVEKKFPRCFYYSMRTYYQPMLVIPNQLSPTSPAPYPRSDLDPTLATTVPLIMVIWALVWIRGLTKCSLFWVWAYHACLFGCDTSA